MSWSLDTSAQSTYGSGGPHTLAYTCGASAKVLVAVLFVNGITARTGGAPTYNGVSMTDSGAGFKYDAGGECGVEIWYLIDPSTGSSYNISVPNTGGVSMQISAMSFVPSSGACAIDKFGSASGVSSTPSATVTAVSANSLMVGGCGSGDRDVPSAGGVYTLLHTYDAGNQVWASEYDLDTGTAGNIAVNFTTARSDDWGVIGISFKETTPPTVLVVADSYSTSAVDGISITKSTTLSVQDASVTTQVDDVVAARVRVTWAEMQIPKAAGTPTLSIQDAFVTTQTDNVSLDAGGTTLAVQDAFSITQADAVTIAQLTPVSLTVQDAYVTVKSEPIGQIKKFYDNFDDNSIDTSKWVLNQSFALGAGIDSLVTISESGGELIFTNRVSTTGTHYNGIESKHTVDMAKGVSVEVTQVTGTAGGTMFSVGTDIDNRFTIETDGGDLYLSRRVGGVSSDTTVTYNATTHKFWRLRYVESDDTIRYDTSPDGVGSWTERRSVARGGVGIGNARVTFASGTWASRTASYSKFDNFNIPINAPDRAEWKSPSIAVQSSSTEGDWDYILYAAQSPCQIVKLGGMYFMYYTGCESETLPDYDPVDRALGVAYSTDMVHWTKYSGNPIITYTTTGGAQAEEGVGGCCAVVVAGTVHLYYAAIRWIGTDQVDLDIRYRSSTDGLTFTNDTLIYSSAGDEYMPTSVHYDGSTWRLYLKGPMTTGKGVTSMLSGASPTSLGSKTAVDSEPITGLCHTYFSDNMSVLVVDRNNNSYPRYQVRMMNIDFPTTFGELVYEYTIGDTFSDFSNPALYFDESMQRLFMFELGFIGVSYGGDIYVRAIAYDETGDNYSLAVNDAYVVTTASEVSASGAATLSVQDASVTTQVDAVVTTKQSTLTVQDAAVNTQADDISITKQSTLIVQDASVTTQVDAIVMSAASTLTVQDASVTTQVDAVVTTKQSTLTVQDAFVTSQADIADISKQSTLNVQDASVTTQVDAVVTTKQSTLTVQDAAVTTQVDAVSISKQSTLIVQDAFVTSQADTVTMSAEGALSVQDASVTTQVDAVSISKQSTLTVDSAFATTQADAISIAQNHTLVVNDAAVVTYADPVTLSSEGSLSVADAFVTTSSDSVSITQTNVLAVQDASVSPYADSVIVSAIGNVVLHPSSDTLDGLWTNESGNSTNLYASIDESSYSDADYIKSEHNPVNSPVVFAIGGGFDPEVSYGHIVRYRYWKGPNDAMSVNFRVQLRQGYVDEGSPGTLIAEWLHADISNIASTAEQTLSVSEADSISDYSSLFIRMVAEMP